MKCSDCIHYEAHKFFNPSFFDGKQPGDVERRCGMFRVKDDGRQVVEWINTADRLPEENNDVLILIESGKCRNVVFENAIEFGSYSKAGGWFVDEYPDAEELKVSKWCEIPYPEELFD